MPIYAYKCSACGHAADVLQKISDAPLTVCPNCGQATYTKQVTAAGFQLKGSGWYVTDFRGNGSAGASSAAQPAGSSESAAAASSSGDSGTSSGTSAAPAAATPAPSTPSSST